MQTPTQTQGRTTHQFMAFGKLEGLLALLTETQTFRIVFPMVLFTQIEELQAAVTTTEILLADLWELTTHRLQQFQTVMQMLFCPAMATGILWILRKDCIIALAALGTMKVVERLQTTTVFPEVMALTCA